MLRVLLKFIGFAIVIALPTLWLYKFWEATANMPQVEVPIPGLEYIYGIAKLNVTLPEAMLVAAMFGLLLGFLAVFVLFGGSRRMSRKKLRRQIDRLRSELSESEAEVEVLKDRRSLVARPAPKETEPLKLAPAVKVGPEKPEPEDG